jgi:response regulator RpfG family c-di-GMP phosphodiesterase
MAKQWKILVVDDEPGLHSVTNLVLKRLQFSGRSLNILSALSADEGRKMFLANPDIAVAIIDVVMETDQAGLDLIKDVRDEYKMRMPRIILRTGNPGLAPEMEIIEHFQIDDYRDKTELTSDRLYTSVFTALRSYQTISAMEQTANGLEWIIKSGANLIEHDSFTKFVTGLLEQIVGLTAFTSDILITKEAIAATHSEADTLIVFGSGLYKNWLNRSIRDVAPIELVSDIEHALISGDLFEVKESGVLISLCSPMGGQFALWISSNGRLENHTLRLLSIFIEKLRLSIENQKLNLEIISAQREVLSKLCEAVEKRSKETGAHIYRIAKYAKRLAQLSGMSSEQCEDIEMASPLHDIGKITTPDQILNKPGKLTAEEMSIMRQHTVAGWELLQSSPMRIFQLGAEIALTHHEKWDGTGYPNSIKGEDIPIFGRIVSLVDAFDALLSKRVYKEAFSLEKTIEILREGSSSSFDPILLKIMLDNIDEFHDIFLAHPD